MLAADGTLPPPCRGLVCLILLINSPDCRGCGDPSAGQVFLPCSLSLFPSFFLSLSISLIPYLSDSLSYSHSSPSVRSSLSLAWHLSPFILPSVGPDSLVSHSQTHMVAASPDTLPHLPQPPSPKPPPKVIMSSFPQRERGGITDQILDVCECRECSSVRGRRRRS